VQVGRNSNNNSDTGIVVTDLRATHIEFFEAGCYQENKAICQQKQVTQKPDSCISWYFYNGWVKMKKEMFWLDKGLVNFF
jgi:hypothetical protein